jgi:hypothetical protein
MPLDAIVQFIAENERIAAPVAALLVSWVLYGLLGKRLLGADDDFWPAIRRRILPALDKIGATSDLYAAGEMSRAEYVGRVQMDLDAFEEELQSAGFYRNPLAAYKTSPQGWQSDGSWARRYGTLRGWAETVRSYGLTLKDDPIPLGTLPGWLVGALGRFTLALGDILAARQLHVTVFEHDGDLYLFAHDEWNSLNPLTAWQHFRAKTFDPKKGVEAMQAELAALGIEYDRPKPGE